MSKNVIIFYPATKIPRTFEVLRGTNTGQVFGAHFMIDLIVSEI